MSDYSIENYHLTNSNEVPANSDNIFLTSDVSELFKNDSILIHT